MPANNNLGKFHVLALEVGHRRPQLGFHLEFEMDILNVYFHETSTLHDVKSMSLKNYNKNFMIETIYDLGMAY
jgi:hypothetical protein